MQPRLSDFRGAYNDAYGEAIDRYNVEIRLLQLLLLGLTTIIVVVDLVPIQSQLDSFTLSATNIQMTATCPST